MALAEAATQACRLFDLVSSPLASSIYQTHPNDLATDPAFQVDAGENALRRITPEWNAWWQWSGNFEDAWRVLVDLSNSIDFGDGISNGIMKDSDKFSHYGLSTDLIRLLVDAKTLSLPRQPRIMPAPGRGTLEITSSGMSPKKHHEVSRMVTYVLNLLDALLNEHHIEVRHIVDIGAGQGYLSRSLCNARKLHVLALDSSQRQSEGSIRQFNQSKSKGTLTHRTCWLGEGPTLETHPGLQGKTLECTKDFNKTIDEWISVFCMRDDGARKGPVPVAFLALHACGSLTPSILREVLSHLRNQDQNEQTWYVAVAVVVGCCYNLMQKEDFPLSQTLKSHMECRSSGFQLSSNHLQLAAQMPAHWFRSPDTESATMFAMKKILFRALTSPLLIRSNGDELPKKLGKLNADAYESFETYVVRAGQKIGLDLLTSYREMMAQDLAIVETTVLARRIKTLHTLRCLLGPPVESLIILDRYLHVQEELGENSVFDVQLVNLFDQETGSGRNVAIVLALGSAK